MLNGTNVLQHAVTDVLLYPLCISAVLLTLPALTKHYPVPLIR